MCSPAGKVVGRGSDFRSCGLLFLDEGVVFFFLSDGGFWAVAGEDGCVVWESVEVFFYA